jgi:hypothetical protein
LSDIVTKRALDEDHCPDCGAELEFCENEESSDFHSRTCDASCPKCGQIWSVCYELTFTGFVRLDEGGEGKPEGEWIDADEGVAS